MLEVDYGLHFESLRGTLCANWLLMRNRRSPGLD